MSFHRLFVAVGLTLSLLLPPAFAAKGNKANKPNKARPDGTKPGGKKERKKPVKAKLATVEKVELTQGKTNEGTVTIKSAARKKKGEGKFTITATTQIVGKKGKKDDKPAAISLKDIHPGDKIMISGQPGAVAKLEVKAAPKKKAAAGKAMTIAKVEMTQGKNNEGTLIVKTGTGKKAKETKIAITSTTPITKAGKLKKGQQAPNVPLKDLHAGDKIVVSQQDGKATKVEVKQAPKKKVVAKSLGVVKVDMAQGKNNEGSIVVKSGAGKKATEAKYTISSKTEIVKAGKLKKGEKPAVLTLKDIKAGDKVVVVGQGGTAEKLEVKQIKARKERGNKKNTKPMAKPAEEKPAESKIKPTEKPAETKPAAKPGEKTTKPAEKTKPMKKTTKPAEKKKARQDKKTTKPAKKNTKKGDKTEKTTRKTTK